jgi:hypothetical protein
VAPVVPVDYRMYEKNGQWLVYDLVIDNVSLIANYRSSFNTEIRRDGIDGLIRRPRPDEPEGRGVSQARLQFQGRSEGVARYALVGVLDFQTVPGLLPDGQRMLEGEGPLELDLVEVREANSAGLALLLEWIDLAGPSRPIPAPV